MLRQKLLTAIKSAVAKTRYGLYSDFEYNINTMNVVFPAAWMSPVEIIDIDGRNEGFITYRIVIQLMKTAKKITPQIKEEYWAQMETEAMEIISALSRNYDISIINNIKLAPAEYTLSKHGEISMKLSFDTRMHFYEPA